MKTVLFRSALSCALSIVALSASAQQMKVESQGEAAVEAQKEALVAMSMSKAIGLPAPGKGQVVSWRNRPEGGVCKTFLRMAKRCCLIEGHWTRRCSRFHWTMFRENLSLCFRPARRFRMPAFRQTVTGFCTRPPRRGVNAEGSTPAEASRCGRTQGRDYRRT